MTKREICCFKVISGAGRGRRAGVPTINLAIPQKFNLEPGIYSCRVFFPDQGGWHRTNKLIGVIHYGPIPTFGKEEFSLEVHLIDWQGTFDQGKLGLELGEFIRPVKFFATTKKLVAQIIKDIDRTRHFFEKSKI